MCAVSQTATFSGSHTVAQVLACMPDEAASVSVLPGQHHATRGAASRVRQAETVTPSFSQDCLHCHAVW